MVPVEPHLIKHIEEDQHCTGNTHGKAKYIDNGESFVAIEKRKAIVDDDRDVLDSLKQFLKYEFNVVGVCSNPNLIPEYLDREAFDVVLLDMNFTAGINTGNEGIYWLNQIKNRPEAPVVVPITAYGDIDVAVRAIQEGAVDFVVKPWDNDKLLTTLKASLQLRDSKKEINRLKKRQNQLYRDLSTGVNTYRGTSRAMERVYSILEKVAGTDANILLTGENGTGKEVIAREIHMLSLRKEGPFVPIDLGALHDNLFESELFGHVKGAFTDAREDRSGKFELAEGGTLFLDEISNVPLFLQTKLLSAIQMKEISRLGSNERMQLDTRFICATNKDLKQMTEDHLFREDLLYRINTVEIQIPPLRERENDILFLAEKFLEEFSSKYEKHGIRIDMKAQKKLLKHPWPGNVRELRHTIEKAVIMGEEKVLRPEDLYLVSRDAGPGTYGNVLNLEELEKSAITRALELHSGNVSMAASKLGISRPTLYKKIGKYGLRP